MSRIGKKPIDVPAGVDVKIDNSTVKVKGPLGELSREFSGPVQVKIQDKQVVLTSTEDTAFGKSYHGMARSLISNMIVGVTTGFFKELEIQGVGFKAALAGKKATFSLGYSRPIDYDLPDGIKMTIDQGTMLKISGVDNQKVGEVAAHVRSFFPVEPYKGKGIRYKNEHVRRKVGKTVA